MMASSVGFVLLFAVATALGRVSQLPGMSLAVVWPAAGVGFVWLAGVWRRPRARWSAAALLLVSSLLTQLATSQRPLLAVCFAVAATVQALVACAVHQRLQPLGFRLRQPRDLWALLIASGVGAGAGALIGATTAVLDLGQPVGLTVLGWVVRHSTGTFVVAAVWLRSSDRRVVRAPAGGWGEYVVVLLACGVFFAWLQELQQVPLTFLMVPAAVWLGLRAPGLAALITVSASDVLLIVLTRAGSGPFADVSALQRVIDVQLLVLVLTALTIMLVLHREERHRLDAVVTCALEEARSSARLLNTVFETTAESLTVYDSEATVLMRNRAAQQVFQGLPEGLDTSTWDESFRVTHPDGSPWPVSDLPLSRALRGEVVEGVDLRIATVAAPRGRLFNLTAHPMPLEAAQKLPQKSVGKSSLAAPGPGAVLALRDVTEARVAQARLAASEQRFRTAFDTAPVAMMIVGLDESDATRILQVNETLCTFTGLSVEELLVRDFHDLTHPDDRAECILAFAPFLLGEVEQARAEKRYQHADGSIRWGMLSATVMDTSPADVPADAEGSDANSTGNRTDNGTDSSTDSSTDHNKDHSRDHNGLQLLCLIEDITARKAAESALRHQALHDALTGLPNRTLLHDRLAHALAAAGRDGSRVGVLFLDLDGFKAVNDSAGHAAGDELLREVAARFSACLRPGDTLARLGGDEFAVVCPGVVDEAGLEVVAQRLLGAVHEPVLLVAGTFTVGVSIGTSLGTSLASPHRLDAGEEVSSSAQAERVLAEADAAMYEAKRAGKNRTHRHDMSTSTGDARASRLLPQLRSALEAEEFVLHGQPVLDLATGVVVAVETLLRWQHPQRGLLTPAAFLDVAEASPLMLGIGRRVLEESCRMAAVWSEQLSADWSHPAPAVHVNVSGRQLETGNLYEDTMQALQRTGLPAYRLVLELTETHMPRITPALLADLQRLRDRGVRIAIDDLGTGYSSLARLTQLPVDVLKIDLAFVAGLGVDPSCDAVVRAVLGLGQALGVSVVAEGVETPRQAELLRGYGADTVQGYLYSPPRPERELNQFLRSRASSRAARTR